MIKTKIKKALAITAMAAIVTTQSSVFAASTIGQGTVIGDAAFDTNIVWDDLFPGSASGTVSGIEVQAQVLPTLNMSVSASEINLGVLTAGIAASGNIDIEIGT
ncbi:MAG: hypothetical protein GY828_01945, partial [Candidatus Gracilibacteria bacterium]|nr:hypothetical protein [Candidatus Gracilibacteria bacterium]